MSRIVVINPSELCSAKPTSPYTGEAKNEKGIPLGEAKKERSFHCTGEA